MGSIQFSQNTSISVDMFGNGFKAFMLHTVRKDLVDTAKKAVDWQEGKVDVICLHVDVDVISSG